MSDKFTGSSKPVKILYFGDGACVTTGFGRVAQGILDGLYDTGNYDIVQLGLNYHGDPHNKPYDIFPIRSDDVFGRKRLYEVMLGTNPDILMTNNDIWASMWVHTVLTEVRQLLKKPIPWINYFPIDGLPFKHKWVNFIRNSIDIPVTYTKWASDVIRSIDKEFVVEYSYHGVDTDIFKPDPDAKKQMREQLSDQLGMDIKFVIGYVGRNQPRKRLPELMAAYKQFAKGKKDVLLYLHTGAVDMGWDLKEVKETLQIGKDTPILITPNHFPSMGMSDYKLSGLYQFFDVLCLPTVGEGFGLPFIEGMASGCPIVTTKCSVTPEIVGMAGMLVSPDSMQIMPRDNEMIRPIPSVTGMAEAFEQLYTDKDTYEFKAEQALGMASLYDNWNIPFWEQKIQQAVDMIEEKESRSKGLDFDLDLFEEVK